MTGRELRGCWTQRPAGATSLALPIVGAPPVAVHRLRRTPSGRDGRVPERDFVPVEDLPRRTEWQPVSAEMPPEPTPDASVDVPLALLDPGETWESRTSLFGEPER